MSHTGNQDPRLQCVDGLSSAEAHLVDFLGLRVKATRTASMFAGVRSLAGRSRFFSNTEPLVSDCWQSL